MPNRYINSTKSQQKRIRAWSDHQTMILIQQFNKIRISYIFRNPFQYLRAKNFLGQMEPCQVNHTGALVNGNCTKRNFSKSSNENEIQIPVPWGHIAGRTYGDVNNKPILAVHGWMDNAGTFDRLIPMLSKSLYIVAVDLPGHGRSSHLPLGMPYHFLDNLITLRRISNHFKWTRFSWLGHSMGAALGAMYASFYPDQIERLVMLDLLMPLTRSGEDFAERAAIGIDQFLALDTKIQPNPPSYSYEDALNRVLEATRVSREGAISLMNRGAFQVGDDAWSFSRDLRLRSPSILRLNNDQKYAILRNIRCAVLAFKASGGYMDDSREEFQTVLKIYETHCSEFSYIQLDGGHHFHLDEPEKCAVEIDNFFAKL